MTAVRQMPGNGFFFATHEYLSFCAETFPNTATHPAVTRFAVGGLTGIIFNLVFYPFDVVKARTMVASTSDSGALHVARALLQEAGWAGFYRGLGVVLLRSFPVNALGFLTLQTSRDLLTVTEP